MWRRSEPPTLEERRGSPRRLRRRRSPRCAGIWRPGGSATRPGPRPGPSRLGCPCSSPGVGFRPAVPGFARNPAVPGQGPADAPGTGGVPCPARSVSLSRRPRAPRWPAGRCRTPRAPSALADAGVPYLLQAPPSQQKNSRPGSARTPRGARPVRSRWRSARRSGRRSPGASRLPRTWARIWSSGPGAPAGPGSGAVGRGARTIAAFMVGSRTDSAPCRPEGTTLHCDWPGRERKPVLPDRSVS